MYLFQTYCWHQVQNNICAATPNPQKFADGRSLSGFRIIALKALKTTCHPRMPDTWPAATGILRGRPDPGISKGPKVEFWVRKHLFQKVQNLWNKTILAVLAQYEIINVSSVHREKSLNLQTLTLHHLRLRSRLKLLLIYLAGWWFQPLWNILVRLDHHPNWWGK